MSLQLISINVERSKHLDLAVPFVEGEAADVVCVQEIIEADIPLWGRSYPHHVFAPMQRRIDEEGKPVSGVAIFSRTPFAHQSHYYAGSPSAVPESDRDASKKAEASNRILLVAECEKDNTHYRIATTHFTWSPRGEATKDQQADMEKLLSLLAEYDEFALCGDFNAPRGGVIFAQLAERYKDNIPPHYATSIDLELHRAGKLRPHELVDKMVDGLFTTPGYVASDVRLVSGVSDHCAIVASLLKST